MAETVYLVQCWDKSAALVSSYETLIGSTAELRSLKKFLESKHSHVILTPIAKKRGAK